MKNVALLTEDGTFALFFRPHLGEFDSSKVPTPGNLPSKAKKCQCPGLSPEEGGWWNWLMHYEKINPSEWHKPVNALIECFHSRGQHLFKYIGTKESVCIRKEFNSCRIGLGHQHGRRFIVFGHQHGRRDVMWKHSILIQRISFWSMRRDINLLLFIFRTNFPAAHFFGTYFSVTFFLRKCRTCSRSLFFHCRSFAPCIGGC